MSRSRKKSGQKAQRAAASRPSLKPQQAQLFQQAIQAQTTGNLAFAERAWRALIADRVRLPTLFNNLGMVCAQTGRQDEAAKLFQQALAIDPRFPDARLHLAAIYEQAGKTEQAVVAYERLLSEFPKMHVARYLLANLLKAQGKLEQATEHYRKIHAQRPDYTQAHFTYSGIHKYRDAGDRQLAEMLELYAQDGLAAEGRTQLAFALAKAFEDLRDFPRAFEYLKAGNDLRYAKYQYGIEGDQALFDNIIETFSKEALERLQAAGRMPGNTSERPIFIVGMPRSGTTLVEQILSSHSDVFPGGELDYLYSLGARLFMGEENGYKFRALDSYEPELFESMGQGYLEQIGRLNGQARRVTDKMPLNFMMTGLIHLALPQAKIIHCVRDPRDICLSIYKQNFTTENYRFAYDLRTVGQWCNLYRRLMRHWQQVLPGKIYDIEYELLTHDPEAEIRKLLAACGLEWQDACLQFDKADSMVKTASFYQVRQPMYTSSVQLWQRYEPFLGPLLEELESFT